MATIQEIADRVIGKTSRYDLAASIPNTVTAAVRFFHKRELWDLDLKTTDPALSLSYENADSNQSQVERPAAFRKIHLAVPKLSFPAQTFKELTVIAAEDVFSIRKQGGKKQENTCFLHGNNIIVYCSKRPDILELSFWANPVIPDENFEDWLTTEHEELLYHYCCQQVYIETGADKRANMLGGVISPLLTNLYAEGRHLK